MAPNCFADQKSGDTTIYAPRDSTNYFVVTDFFFDIINNFLWIQSDWIEYFVTNFSKILKNFHPIPGVCSLQVELDTKDLLLFVKYCGVFYLFGMSDSDKSRG